MKLIVFRELIVELLILILNPGNRSSDQVSSRPSLGQVLGSLQRTEVGIGPLFQRRKGYQSEEKLGESSTRTGAPTSAHRGQEC